MVRSLLMGSHRSTPALRWVMVLGGLAAGMRPTAAEDLADRFPDLKMPILAAVEEPTPEDSVEAEQTAESWPSNDLAPMLSNIQGRPTILGSTAVANYDAVPRLPGDRDFAAIVDEARREAKGLAPLGKSSVAHGMAQDSENDNRTAASFASHRRPHCRHGSQACPPQPCQPIPQRGGAAVAEYPGSQSATAAPSAQQPTPGVVPLPDSMQAEAPAALPDVQRQLPQLARADIGATRETWADTPYLVGDGCSPMGNAGKVSVGRIAILAPNLDTAGSGGAAAQLNSFTQPQYGSVQAIQGAGYPAFTLPTQGLGTVPGTPPTSVPLGSPVNGITPINGSPSATYTAAAQNAFQTNPALPTGSYPGGVATFDPTTSGALPGTSPGQQDAFLFYNYMVDAGVVLPGYAVGFVKLTENMSPIPRDRVYMNYSYFKNANFFNDRADVNRFMPGFEKTFYDGWTSIELRTPFAATVASSQYIDPNLCGPNMAGTTQYRDIEFGNMSVIFKTLIWEQNTWAITTGMQVMLPTAANSQVYSSLDGTPATQQFQSVFVANESVHAMPFLGSVWAPNDRFFNQALLQMDVDCNGNLCYVNSLADPTLSGRQLTQIGRARYPTFMYLSFGTGYWLYKDNTSNFTGFSPIMELHVNQAFNDFQPVTSANGYVLGINQGIVSVTNALIGCNFEWGERSTLTFAYVTPIGGGADRFFDGEVRALYNWRFGPQNNLRRAQF